MRILAFYGAPDDIRLGVVRGRKVVDLTAVDPDAPRDLAGFLRHKGMAALGELAALAERAPESALRDISGVDFAIPVGSPGKIICLGLNYADHVDEGPFDKQPYPTLFMRAVSSLVPHEASIQRPRRSQTLDYEAELALVIGRRARHLTLSEATSVVAGYSCFNDASVRDYQRHTMQWTMGKNFDRTGAFGPWIVSADELPDGCVGLDITCRLNGEVVQSSNTRHMIFPVAETLVYLTEGMTLEPGDVVVMGTPSGVGHARKPPLWMRNGDVVEVEIQDIGLLRNVVEDEVGGEPAA